MSPHRLRNHPSKVFGLLAEWDGEAGVWVATSEDVPGLVTEAETVEALMEKLRVLVPELLELNATNAVLKQGGLPKAF